MYSHLPGSLNLVTQTVPETRIPPPHVEPQMADAATSQESDAAVAETSAVRKYLLSRGNSAVADGAFHGLMVLCGLSIFFIVGLIVWELMQNSALSWHKFGFHFFFQSFKSDFSSDPLFWDPVNNRFSALPFIYGTLVSSFLALLMAVPLAVGLAIFLTEMCPRILRGPLAFLTELLAAIPSIVYGVWAMYVLVPLLREHVNPLLIRWLGWTGLFNDQNPTGLGYFAAGVILAIMILPIISSLTREVMTAVPHSQREAVLALGATRWEMIRVGVLRNARIGIVGGIILGLGRALGETMAATMVIGNTPEIHKSLLSNGGTMAAVIANEFTEAVSDVHRSALIEIGLALFVVTIVVNALAQLLMWAVTRGTPSQAR
ncbi:MAG TPA: phosphate ABC transporter permease subunit PstC [Terracidiphilus sp.]|nr:phosphate ABC transporter permease subunit PstC [Terracidiphilus sp.]